MNVGDTIGNNKIISRGISGGFGVVYPAYDEMLDRRVALKVLHPHLLQDEARLSTFRNEARTLARLNHPNIATLYNLIEQDGQFFMVMEYVDGPTFHQIVRGQGALSAQLAVPMICHALSGLAHAHSMRVIHRDIKSGNLMVNSERVVKIMDFGIARHLGGERHTKTGGIMGSVEYMSPEQIRAGEIDERSDLYSLGVVMYELLTGRVPFSGSSEFEVLRGHMEVRPPLVCDVARDVPVGVALCVEVALCKERELRFATAAEFKQELIEALAGKPAPARWQTMRAAMPPVAASSMPSTAATEGGVATQPADEQPLRKPRINIDFAGIARRVIRGLAITTAVAGLCIGAAIYGPVLWAKVQTSGIFDSHPKPAVVQNARKESSSGSGRKSGRIRVRSHSSGTKAGGSYAAIGGDNQGAPSEAPDSTIKARPDDEVQPGADGSDTSGDKPPNEGADGSDTSATDQNKPGDTANGSDESKSQAQ